MSEELRSIRGIEISVEAFGSDRDPCVLLIMGAMASMLWWDERLCRQLAARGLFVIRFDHRDVGRSTSYPVGVPPYSVDDLVADDLAVASSFGCVRAHWVGMSLGGMLAQVAALRHPSRVASITAIASRIFDDRPELPPIAPEVLAYHARAGALDWTDERAVCAYMVGARRLLAGSRHPFDEAAAEHLARQEFRRARSLPSMFHHALLAGATDLYGRASELRAPLVSIHGTEDRVLSIAHAEALVAAVPGARLVRMAGAGHEIHELDWPIIIEEIVQQVARR